MSGPGSVVGIATRSELNGPWMESRLRRDVPHPSRPALWPTQLSYTMGAESFPGVALTTHPT